MSLQSRYRFTTAWLPEGWRRNVVISVDPAGDIVDVAPDDVVTTARLVNGAAIPGMPNIHSHAFQRAMAGLAEQRGGAAAARFPAPSVQAPPVHTGPQAGLQARAQTAAQPEAQADSFWTWRETMYELAAMMTPECLNAIAAQLYADMLKAGYTSVCEFHYLHNRPDGQAYENPSAMCQALVDAAATAGIGMTLLPTLYQTSDFGEAPPAARQRQFTLATDAYLELLGSLRGAGQASAQLEIGIALHSLRAVPPAALREVLAAQPDCKAIHIHIAEQQREVLACQQHLGRRPVEWLLEHARPDARWCLVHATHVTPAELEGVAATQAVIGLCPTTEGNLGDGIFPLAAWLAAGGAFAIGSDSHIGLSPGEELRWLEYQVRLARQQRNVLVDARGTSGGALLWQHACAAGARASGRPVGAFEVGRRADIVVLDLNLPLFAGRADERIIDTFVFAGPGNAVRDVMVGGRWLVQEGRHFAETAVAAGYRRAIQKMLTSI